MRILVATDGSENAEQALAQVATLDWGPRPVVRVATAVSVTPTLDGMVTADLVEAAVAEEMKGSVARAKTLLAPTGAEVEGVVRPGRAADVILEEAGSFGADVIVVGHRGRSAVATLLLGSVAAEVAERSTRPVLVVRGTVAGPAIFADDGSPPARAARRVIATWPAFAGRSIRVLSVAHTTAPLASGITATMRREAAEAQREDLAAVLAERTETARQAEAELRAAGRDATAATAVGDVGPAIIDAARDARAGLIVVGCRGHGIEGLLGTTARSVVLRAPCSVLVVHAPH